MAIQQGITGFVKVTDSSDPGKVYAIGTGGRPIADEQDLMKATGASSVAEAWKIAGVKEIGSAQAKSYGINLPEVSAAPATPAVVRSAPVYNPSGNLSAENLGAYKGTIDLGGGVTAPTTIVPKVPVVQSIIPEAKPVEAPVTVADTSALGERFGVDTKVVPNFKPGLPMESQRNIETLIATKPQTQWTEKDWTDYRYATIPEQTSTDLKNIQTAFNNPTWKPSVSQALIDRGILGAVRIEGTDKVFTIGSGGGPVDAQQYRELFGTDSQEGIVGLITQEQAKRLGITETPAPSAPAAPTITPEKMAELAKQATVPAGFTLIDAYTARPDVQAMIKANYAGDPFTAGTPANDALNKWWNDTGRQETKDQILASRAGKESTITASGMEISTKNAISEGYKTAANAESEAYKAAAEEYKLQEKNDAITAIQTQKADREAYYTAQEAAVKNRQAPMAAINKELNYLSNQKTLEMTNLDIRESIAQGNWDRANQLAKEKATQAADSAKILLEGLLKEGEIQQDEYDNAVKFTEWKQSLMEKGYIQISEDEAVSLPVDNYSVLQDGTYWALPVNEEAGDTAVIGTSTHSSLIYTSGPNAGQVIADYYYDSADDIKTSATAAADKQAVITRSTEIVNLVNTVRNAASGWNTGLASLANNIPGTPGYNFQANVKSLKSLLTLENMGVMKGVLSDSDMKVITAAATALDVGMTKDAFLAELSKIETKAKTAASIAQSSFNSVGSDTNAATLAKATATVDGQSGGQCGRFVNNLTGLGVGDSYASKMAKMDPSLKTPAPGMVFVMPYKNYGHTGIILSVSGDYALVKDSNWNLDEKISTHYIKISSITGLSK